MHLSRIATPFPQVLAAMSFVWVQATDHYGHLRMALKLFKSGRLALLTALGVGIGS